MHHIIFANGDSHVGSRSRLPSFRLCVSSSILSIALLTISHSTRARALQSGQVMRSQLRAADAVSRESFSGITSVRELSDGRVLVSDYLARREERIVVVDWKTGSASGVSRQGNGPGEWASVGRLLGYGSDSTIFKEPRSLSWDILKDTTIVRRLSASHPANRFLRSNLYGVDSTGRVLGAVGFNRRGSTYPLIDETDSLLVILLGAGALSQQGSVRPDTIARIRGSALDGPCSGGGGGASTSGGAATNTLGSRPPCNPLGTQDLAILAADGWIALARTNPYRIEWRSPIGQWVRGAPLSPAPSRVTTSDKCAALMRMGRSAEARCDPSVTDQPHTSWPQFLPPFLGHTVRGGLVGQGVGTLMIDGAGNLVVRRTPSAGTTGTEYDVLDRRGVLVGAIRLGPREAIVGFGRRHVYTFLVDNDDVQQLRRHPWSIN